MFSGEPEGAGEGGGVAIDLTGVVVGGTIVVVEGEMRGGAATMADFFLAKRASMAASPAIAAVPTPAASTTAEGRGGMADAGSIFCVPDAAITEVFAGGAESGTGARGVGFSATGGTVGIEVGFAGGTSGVAVDVGGAGETGTDPVGGFKAGAAAVEGGLEGRGMRPVVLFTVVGAGRMVPVGGFNAGAALTEGAEDEPVGTVPVGGFEKSGVPVIGAGMKAVLGTTAAAGVAGVTTGVGGLLTGAAEGDDAVETGEGTDGGVGVAAVIGFGANVAVGVGAGTTGAALTGLGMGAVTTGAALTSFGMGGGTIGAALASLGTSGINGGGWTTGAALIGFGA